MCNVFMRPASEQHATVAEARVRTWSAGDGLPTSVLGSRIEVLECVPLRIAIARTDDQPHST